MTTFHETSQPEKLLVVAKCDSILVLSETKDFMDGVVWLYSENIGKVTGPTYFQSLFKWLYSPIEPIDPVYAFDATKGGGGSGNWGHAGRPGRRGGSAPGGGHRMLEQRYGVTRRGEESAATQKIDWKPAMNVAMAEKWNMGSAIQGDVFHVTADKNLRPITTKGVIKGFDLSIRKFGRVWGNGVYMSDNQETIDMYRDWSGGEATTLRMRVNAKNVFVLKEGETYNENGDYLSPRGYVNAHVSKKLGRELTINETMSLDTMLVAGGYDAMHLIPKYGPTDGASGGDQIVVFDPKNVVVVGAKLSTGREVEVA